ncbi:glycosyltransferase family 39 protein [Ilyomonas limi]|uniref:Glycosyltransferase family 39 protein n=1 Tax=Ilyomonas limi TaxID=2575867 RepID=A0A4V5UUN3_9BACT|nr:glycosyltransferase family 39 protein [Ilyomonas limi]TKK68283.1 glycosyltransferase family 39 protein [Ilyomonas limi]
MKINSLGFIIIAAIILLFVRLGGTSVFQVAEARNSQCAYEMMTTGDMITPTFNGILRTDKPALEYYAMIAAYKLFGKDEGSARFFSGVCGLIVIISTFFFVRKHATTSAAWWSAFILLSSMHTIVQFRLATPDPYLILCHVLSLYCFIEGFTSRQFKWYALMYILLGLGIFAKGPVALALPGLTMVLYLLFTKQFTLKNIVRLQPWFGVLLIALFCVPWYYLVHVRTGGAWTRGFFFEHNVGRFDEPVDNHGGLFIITFLFVILGMFPFSAFFIRVGKYVWQNRKTNHFLLFNFIAFWVVVGFYFFSSTRLLNYTTPAYPFFAIMIGCWLADRLPVFSFKNIKPELLIICILTMILPLGIYTWAVNTEPVDNVSWIAFPLLVFTVGGIAALVYARQNISKALRVIGCTYMVATLLVFAWLFPALDSQTPMEKHKQFIGAADNVVAYQNFNDAFVYYTKHPIPLITDIDSLAAYINTHNNAVVISKSKQFKTLDSLPSIKLYSKDMDLFSVSYSAIYIKSK